MTDTERKPIKILVVEDHEIVRLGLRLTLQGNGAFEVVSEASDGDEAIEKALQVKPDVILMDIGLKNIDGIQAAKSIKSKRPDMKVLMVTSYDNDETIFAALSAGADGYCLKNASAENLANAIHAVYSGAAWLDPGIAKRVFAVQTAAQVKATKQPAGPFLLSPREQEVLSLIADGLTNAQIAQKLVVSPETVKTHVRHLMEKMLVSDRTQVAVKALKEGYLP